MSVKVITNPPEEKNYLDLRLDNGDLSKLDQVIKEWNFKDYQSFFRFSISIMLVTEEKFLAILQKGEVNAIKPAPDYVN